MITYSALSIKLEMESSFPFLAYVPALLTLEWQQAKPDEKSLIYSSNPRATKRHLHAAYSTSPNQIKTSPPCLRSPNKPINPSILMDLFENENCCAETRVTCIASSSFETFDCEYR